MIFLLCKFVSYNMYSHKIGIAAYKERHTRRYYYAIAVFEHSFFFRHIDRACVYVALMFSLFYDDCRRTPAQRKPPRHIFLICRRYYLCLRSELSYCKGCIAAARRCKYRACRKLLCCHTRCNGRSYPLSCLFSCFLHANSVYRRKP